MLNISREDGFTVSEMLVSTVVMLLVTGAALTTFRNALNINETAGQLADANQNLRAGTNTLVRDLMMAGRIIASTGIPVPNGTGAAKINRPAPPGQALTFDLLADQDGVLTMPSLTTGDDLGPVINGSKTDIVTIMTVDEFQPVIQSTTGTPTGLQAKIEKDGTKITLPTSSPWLVGDTTNDTRPLAVGDLVLFKNAFGSSVQTVTKVDSSAIYFENDSTKDWFRFNQRGTSYKGTIYCIKTTSACDTPDGQTSFPGVTSTVQNLDFPDTSMFRALMITYYVDATTTPSTPRLVRQLNHFEPQALSGVVEDLDLTYDLVDSANNKSDVSSLPLTVTENGSSFTYTSNMIKKVNIHVGVRSEVLSKPSQDYVRNHINTAVVVRSMASIDRYNTSQ